MQYDIQNWQVSRWQTDTRYYNVEVCQDLFGTWMCKRSWGGLSNRRGNHMVHMTGSYDDAIAMKESVALQRQKRGYIAVSA